MQKNYTIWLAERTYREILGLKIRTRLLNYLKQLEQFPVSMDAYAYAKNQYHSWIQFWHIPDLKFGITFTPRVSIVTVIWMDWII